MCRRDTFMWKKKLTNRSTGSRTRDHRKDRSLFRWANCLCAIVCPNRALQIGVCRSCLFASFLAIRRWIPAPVLDPVLKHLVYKRPFDVGLESWRQSAPASRHGSEPCDHLVNTLGWISQSCRNGADLCMGRSTHTASPLDRPVCKNRSSSLALKSIEGYCATCSDSHKPFSSIKDVLSISTDQICSIMMDSNRTLGDNILYLLRDDSGFWLLSVWSIMVFWLCELSTDLARRSCEFLRGIGDSSSFNDVFCELWKE